MDADINLSIYRLPPILLIHFKRFKQSTSAYGGMTKIDVPVAFPLVLDMTSLVASKETAAGGEGPAAAASNATLDMNDNSEDDDDEEDYGEDSSATTTTDERHASGTGAGGSDSGKNNKEKLKKKKKLVQKKEARRPLYALRGVIYHSGSLEGGHYTATAFSRTTNRWTSFNDSWTTELAEGRTPEAHGAYILLYEAIRSEDELPPAAYPQSGVKGDESQTKKAKFE
jgi:hypothetical protein